MSNKIITSIGASMALIATLFLVSVPALASAHDLNFTENIDLATSANIKTNTKIMTPNANANQGLVTSSSFFPVFFTAGTVTAVSNNANGTGTLTIQTPSGQSVNVNTNANTNVIDQNGNLSSLTNIAIGAQVKLVGLWDSVLNVFNAIKVKIL